MNARTPNPAARAREAYEAVQEYRRLQEAQVQGSSEAPDQVSEAKERAKHAVGAFHQLPQADRDAALQALGKDGGLNVQTVWVLQDPTKLEQVGATRYGEAPQGPGNTAPSAAAGRNTFGGAQLGEEIHGQFDRQARSAQSTGAAPGVEAAAANSDAAAPKALDPAALKEAIHLQREQLDDLREIAKTQSIGSKELHQLMKEADTSVALLERDLNLTRLRQVRATEEVARLEESGAKPEIQQKAKENLQSLNGRIDELLQHYEQAQHFAGSTPLDEQPYYGKQRQLAAVEKRVEFLEDILAEARHPKTGHSEVATALEAQHTELSAARDSLLKEVDGLERPKDENFNPKLELVDALKAMYARADDPLEALEAGEKLPVMERALLHALAGDVKGFEAGLSEPEKREYTAQRGELEKKDPAAAALFSGEASAFLQQLAQAGGGHSSEKVGAVKSALEEAQKHPDRAEEIIGKLVAGEGTAPPSGAKPKDPGGQDPAQDWMGNGKSKPNGAAAAADAPNATPPNTSTKSELVRGTERFRAQEASHTDAARGVYWAVEALATKDHGGDFDEVAERMGWNEGDRANYRSRGEDALTWEFTRLDGSKADVKSLFAFSQYESDFKALGPEFDRTPAAARYEAQLNREVRKGIARYVKGEVSKEDFHQTLKNAKAQFKEWLESPTDVHEPTHESSLGPKQKDILDRHHDFRMAFEEHRNSKKAMATQKSATIASIAALLRSGLPIDRLTIAVMLLMTTMEESKFKDKLSEVGVVEQIDRTNQDIRDKLGKVAEHERDIEAGGQGTLSAHEVEAWKDLEEIQATDFGLSPKSHHMITQEMQVSLQFYQQMMQALSQTISVWQGLTDSILSRWR